MEVIDLLKKLIAIPSESQNELELCEYIFNLLNENNFNPIKIPVDNDGFNILVKVGNPKVYLAAHMDTVSPILEIKEDKDNIYGRGTCDTKGSLSSMLIAGIKAKEKGLTNFGFIFTVGEEKDFRGAKKIIENSLDIPFVVVGEPTSLEVINGHHGLLTLKITSLGKAAHSSKPEEGINAIDKLIEVLNIIKSKVVLHEDSLMSVVKINGGTATNVIPDKAEVIISFRVSPNDKNDYVKLFKENTRDLAEIEVMLEIPGVYTEVPKQLSFINKVRTVRYCTELSFFKNGVVLGPGDIKYAHGKDEFISKKELEKAVEVYSNIILEFSKIEN